MKLFAVYVGGDAVGSHIELHDMRFVLGERVEDTYPELLKQWWGKPGTLHVDGWSEISRADGYAVTLRPEPYTGEEKLYFLNLGGYDKAEFTELHKNIFVVAPSEQKAKVKALKTIKHWTSFHKDDMYEIERSFCINSAVADYSLYIHLEKIADESPAPFVAKYIPIEL